MGVIIKKRAPVVKNLILFLGLSFVYLFIIESIKNGQSALSLQSFKAYCEDYRHLILLSFIAGYFVFYVKKFSKWPLLVYFSYIIFYSFYFFFDGQDKLILIYSFIYFLFAGYFYIFWNLELNDVVYSAGFFKNQIGTINKQKLNVCINMNGTIYNGFFTNISEYSCFILLDKLIKDHSKYITIKTEFEGREFCLQGEIVTSYGNGLGLKLGQEFKFEGKRTWNEYYAIIRDRSLFPVITGA